MHNRPLTMDPLMARTYEGAVEYTDHGTGRPVLFLHGGHSNCHEYLATRNFDTSRYRLIVPSRPGYGNTPIYPNTGPEEAARTS